MKRHAVLIASLALAACNSMAPPPRVAVAPADQGESLLWARKDGRRMATNPQLYQQGTLDKERCTQEASLSGGLDFQVFSSCMDRAGYVPIRNNG